MRWNVCMVLAVFALGLAAWPVSGGQKAGVVPPVSARQTLDSLLDALRSGDVDKARGLTLPADGFAAISRRPVDRADYDKQMQGFLRSVARELGAGMKIEQVVCADALILPADHKIKKSVPMAVFHVSYSRQGKPAGGPMPFLFIAHQGHWKLYLR